MTPFDPRLPIIAAAAKVKTCHVFHCWQAMREMGRRFHVAAFAQFAGLEERHVEAIVAAMEANDALPEKRSPVTHRATRLPDNWSIPQDWVDWAVDLRQWHPRDVEAEAEVFANYWQSKPGQAATKLDWRKTWQNWVRSSRRPDGDYRPLPEVFNSHEHWERTAALYDKLGRSNEADEIRQRLARTATVIPFTQPPAKVAQNRG